MNFKEKHYNLLVVSSSDAFNQSMQRIVMQFEGLTAQYVDNVSSAKRSLLERTYDLAIINTPLSDEFGTRFSVDASSEHNLIAMLVVKGDVYEGVYDKVLDFGVYVMPKPVTTPQMIQSLRWMCATKERLRRFEKKTMTLEEKMGEIRLVNHAKWILIENLKMTEADAHRYIEKQAMDRCVSRREIAENIINTYT
ncbi:MAG: ANTAR domain-containing response regulator [Christensenellaceae bacterium]